MTNGVLVFEGMKVGVLPGDLKIEVDESGSVNSTLILSTAYNVLPIWLRIASDQLHRAKNASEGIASGWTTNDEVNRELLIAELNPSLQVFVACGIALDALYDQLRPFAKLSESDIQTWKDNKTKRADQISEVVRRVYKIKPREAGEFKQNITEIIKYRDMAVHPSLELKPALSRSDVPVLVDWKFSAYRYSNAMKCFHATINMLGFLYTQKSGNQEVDQQMDAAISALEQLNVVKRQARPSVGAD